MDSFSYAIEAWGRVGEVVGADAEVRGNPVVTIEWRDGECQDVSLRALRAETRRTARAKDQAAQAAVEIARDELDRARRRFREAKEAAGTRRGRVIVR